MRLSQYLPEAIPGPAAVLYSLVPGNLGRPAQRRLAAAVHQALPADARLVVDVGCGAGMDLLLAARAVGPRGRAIGSTPAAGSRKKGSPAATPILGHFPKYLPANPESRAGSTSPTTTRKAFSGTNVN